MKIPIVNEQDEIIGYKDREERNPNDIIRITGIWITDESGQHVLLQQRKWNKKSNPGKWGPGASGTVEEGETYESNAYKELEEETGIKNVQLIESKKLFGESVGGNKRFAQLYLCTVPLHTPLIPEESEVEALKWVTIEEFKKWYGEKPEDFVGATKDIIKLLKI